MRDQEAYVYSFQLRDFLISGTLEVSPRALANALAGLPTMPWQQSADRCSGMVFDPPRLEYCVWELISEVWHLRPTDFEVAPVDILRMGVLKLDRKWGDNRQFLWNNWQDLKTSFVDHFCSYVSALLESLHELSGIPSSRSAIASARSSEED
jgi:hypothetical protein